MYQEQAYLLDPFLERLINPVVEQFKTSVASISSSDGPPSSANIGRLALLLYHYVKFRGYKTISSFTALLLTIIRSNKMASPILSS